MLDSTQLPIGTAGPEPVVSFPEPEPTEPVAEPTEPTEEPAPPAEEPEPTPEATEPAPAQDPITVSFPDGSTLPKGPPR